jgi:hypothetical protein
VIMEGIVVSVKLKQCLIRILERLQEQLNLVSALDISVIMFMLLLVYSMKSAMLIIGSEVE